MSFGQQVSRENILLEVGGENCLEILLKGNFRVLLKKSLYYLYRLKAAVFLNKRKGKKPQN